MGRALGASQSNGLTWNWCKGRVKSSKFCTLEFPQQTHLSLLDQWLSDCSVLQFWWKFGCCIESAKLPGLEFQQENGSGLKIRERTVQPTRWPLHVWNGRGRGPWLHNRRRQSEITALCHLWLCAVAALDKTNDGAEWRISARSVTDFHWTGTDPIHSDRSRSRVSTRIGAFSTKNQRARPGSVLEIQLHTWDQDVSGLDQIIEAQICRTLLGRASHSE